MKKLTLVTLISSALSAGVMAGDHSHKIAMSFSDLDKNNDGYVSRDEATNTAIAKHFDTMNMDENGKLSVKEFNTHVSNNPSHFTGDVVASVQAKDNGVQEVDPKTVSAAGKDDIVMADEAKVEKSSSMTVKTEGDNMKSVSKRIDVEKNVDVDTDELALDDNDAEVEKESTMTVKTEQQNMAGDEKSINIEKNVEVEVEGDTAAIANTDFDEIDTNEDGKLTEAEVAELSEDAKFNQMDRDNDDLITKVEFDTYKRTTLQTNVSEYNEEE
ncbi:hypothetical protein [Alteromonas halophila]|uniref:EF-hand domain-containing protein n=1 Tax=Alteromonas halophila TaxID=516698 RepID=A0A918N1G8_9ALTE|nr:hypothetical protein [Alteromonas halophila]GGW93619.1 hypothetical protein GCM10007391_30040 [Alteromonas halophila]